MTRSATGLAPNGTLGISEAQAMVQRLCTRENNRILSGWNLWFLGYPDRALERMNTAITATHHTSKSLIGDLHGFAMYICELRRETRQMRAGAEARLAIASAAGLFSGRALSEIYLGWADALEGDPEAGIARMQLHLSELKSSGSEYISDRCLSFISNAMGRMKRFEEALRAVDDALQFIEKSGQRFYEAELHRLKGELLLSKGASNGIEAEQCFRKSIEVARRQRAKSWELRATTSLGRLMRDSGRREEAGTKLSEIYGWFTEGFETLDLRDATALLEELNGFGEDILQFWFRAEENFDEHALNRRWFFPNSEFDELCRTKFLGRYEEAVEGRLEHWRDAPRSCVALVLLFDQFPRNMFRGTERAFATDGKAREVSRWAIASGFDRDLPPVMRMFLYLPFEHSENLDDQMESLRLTSALVAENPNLNEALKQAHQHLETIRRFGRFPGRNKALRRESTSEEIRFLEGSRDTSQAR